MDVRAPAPRWAACSLLTLIAAGVLGCSGDEEAATVDSETTLFPTEPGFVQPGTGNDFVAGAMQPAQGGMPADFTRADRGGWKLLGEIPADASLEPLEEDGREAGCGSLLTG